MRLPWVGNVYAALAEENWQRLRVGPGSLARGCRAGNPAAVAASADALGHGPAGAAWSYWHQCRLWVALHRRYRRRTVSLVDIGGGRTDDQGSLQWYLTTKKTPRRGLLPNSRRPRAPTAMASHGPMARPRTQPTKPEHPRRHQPAGGVVWTLKASGPPDAGLKVEARVRHFVGMARGIA